MMRAHWAGVGVLIGLLLCGCQQQASSPAAGALPVRPATSDTIAALRAASPSALIGRVVAVYPEARLAAVADMPVQQFREGDRVNFMGNEGLLTGGVVVRIVPDGAGALHVKWDVPQVPKGRAPIVGDLCFIERGKP